MKSQNPQAPSDSEIRKNLASYALNALDSQDECEAVEELVSRDTASAQELQEMMDTLSIVSMNMGQLEPPPALKQRIVQLIEPEAEVEPQTAMPAFQSIISHIEGALGKEDKQPSYQSANGIWQRVSDALSPAKLAFATSLSAFAVVAILAMQLGADNSHLNRKIDDMERDVNNATIFVSGLMDEVATAEKSLREADARIFAQAEQIREMTAINEALRSSINDQISLTYATLRNEYEAPEWSPYSPDQSDAYAYLLEHKIQPVAALVIGGMVQAPEGEEYRLYLIGEDGPRYAASFDMNKAGYCTVLFPIPAPLSSFNGGHITREPIDSPPDPTLAEPVNRYVPR